MNPAPSSFAGPERRLPRAIVWIRRLAWVYLYLWVFEGVLRKWVVPSLADPLLIIRDPVAILIILLAFFHGLRLSRAFRILYVSFTLLLGTVGFLQIVCGVDVRFLVVLFGLRTDLLHIPLIFILGVVFDHEDVRAMGRHLLWMSLPMALLMVLQFRAPIDATINTVAGGAAGGLGYQLDSAKGHIRPPGTFSFISGPVGFFSLVAAFVFDNGLRRIRVNPILTQVATAGVFLGAIVSGSRSLILSLVLVFAGLMLGFIVNPRFLARQYKILIWCGLTVLGASLAAIVRDGVDTLVTRMETSETFDNGGEQTLKRILSIVSLDSSQISAAGVLGQGLGLGTNVGCKLQTGTNNGSLVFLLGEDEWLRVILESGVIAGIAFIALRLWITVYLFAGSMREAKRGNMLPLLLLGCAAVAISIGQWGPTTNQGCAILSGALCLAAMRMRPALQAPPVFGPGPWDAEFAGEEPSEAAAHPVPSEGEG